MTKKCWRFRQTLGALALIAVLSAWPVRAQEVTARLSGTVKDPAGAVVPDAALTATNTGTGVATRTTSGASGDYVFPQLAPGPYRLTAEKAGFTTAVLSGISLNVDQKASLDIVLQVGQVTQSLNVEAAAPAFGRQLQCQFGHGCGQTAHTRSAAESPPDGRRWRWWCRARSIPRIDHSLPPTETAPASTITAIAAPAGDPRRT